MYFDNVGDCVNLDNTVRRQDFLGRRSPCTTAVLKGD